MTIILTVHDEIVAEVPNDTGSLEEFSQLMTALPDWAAGLPVACKTREGPRFCKIKPVAAPPIVPEDCSPSTWGSSHSCRYPTVPEVSDSERQFMYHRSVIADFRFYYRGNKFEIPQIQMPSHTRVA